MSGGRAKEADVNSVWRRAGDVDVETNRAEEATMLLEQAISAESPENVVFDDGEDERRLRLLASCALELTRFWIHGEREGDGRSVCVLRSFFKIFVFGRDDNTTVFRWELKDLYRRPSMDLDSC